MEKRKLGNTGINLSLIGFGGFHLIETPKSECKTLLNEYLNKGGNYIETAADYGDGISEQKIGYSISHRRDDYILASKCARRTKAETILSIERSLKNLNTDYLDILFMHAVQTTHEADQINRPDGAMEAALQARKEGKIRFIGISGHGDPEALLYAITHAKYDVLMTGFNYFDRFNFPSTETKLIAECQSQGIGLLGMKALADGYLYKSWENGIRYTLTLPIASLVLGINTPEYLANDLAIATGFTPMTTTEKEILFSEAPELGNYICRQCKKCDGIADIDPSVIFEIEGIFDRQMDNGTVPNSAEFALRERLKHWFDQTEKAKAKYKITTTQVNPEKDYSSLNKTCPYNIDIDRKLKLAHSKLSESAYLF